MAADGALAKGGFGPLLGVVVGADGVTPPGFGVPLLTLLPDPELLIGVPTPVAVRSGVAGVGADAEGCADGVDLYLSARD